MNASIPREESPLSTSTRQWIFVGFKEILGHRVFEFEAVAADHSRTPITVSINMALVRHYGIRLQELPLLCKSILERDGAGPQKQFVYAEADMIDYAGRTAAREAAARKRHTPRRATTEPPATGWRAPTN